MITRREWRLPNEAELKSLLVEDSRPGEAKIATDYFPYTKNGPYWTSETKKVLKKHYKHFKKGSLSVNFANGNSRNMPYSDTAFVRLVSKI